MRSSVETIRKHLEALRLVLLAPSPEGIEHCLPHLVDAAASLSNIQREIQSQPDAGLVRELKALRTELVHVRKLAEHGAVFWNAWARMLGSATAGYTASGEAQPVIASATVLTQG